jgi:nitrite reductase/ring-hydroxylating ferredoxin subunit
MSGDSIPLPDGEFRRVARADDIPTGKMMHVELDQQDIVLCRTQEGWFAVQNVCTHAYARLHEGRLRGSRLICPFHGASFDCRNGAVLGPPAVVPLKTYRVRISDGYVEVAVGG